MMRKKHLESQAICLGSARDVVAATVGGIVTGGLAAATCGASLGTAVAGSAKASTIGYLTANNATQRFLELAIPKGATTEQMQAIQHSVEYAKSIGVQLIVHEME